MKLVIATRNLHKLEEIRVMLSIPTLELLNLADFPGIPDVVEDGDTFLANAAKKALAAARCSGLWAMADDSGLEVDALGGRPGVFSARYAGPSCDYAANNAKLLEEMKNRKDRAARFVCAIALSDPDGRLETVEGYCRGSIAFEPAGSSGFGYDPLFVPEGHGRTFAEMGSVEKNAMSHRADAVRRAHAKWAAILTNPSSVFPAG